MYIYLCYLNVIRILSSALMHSLMFVFHLVIAGLITLTSSWNVTCVILYIHWNFSSGSVSSLAATNKWELVFLWINGVQQYHFFFLNRKYLKQNIFNTRWWHSVHWVKTGFKCQKVQHCEHVQCGMTSAEHIPVSYTHLDVYKRQE